jgi:hypothetical protein
MERKDRFFAAAARFVSSRVYLIGQDASAADACSLYDFDFSKMKQHDCPLSKDVRCRIWLIL